MTISLVQRLRFDATRCEATFSRGVATNIEEAATTIEQYEAAIDRAGYFLMGHVDGAYTLQRK